MNQPLTQRFKKGDKVKYIGAGIDSSLGIIKPETSGIIYQVSENGIQISCDNDGRIKGFTLNHNEWNTKYIIKIKDYRWRKL